MLKVVATLGVMALYAASLFGWGQAAARLAKTGTAPWPLAIALGVAVWVFLGGILNFLGVAYALALDAIVALGCALWLAGRPLSALRHLRVGGWRTSTVLRPALAWSLVLAILSFTILTQLPPAAFNYADDFQKYFAHPVRMLETGTLFGSPLSAIGFQDLGGQAVLHAFVLAHFPFSYMNGADAVFCLALCLAMVVESGLRFRAPLGPILLSTLLVVAIDPQYVNIGALYSGSALIMLLIFSMAPPRSHQALRPSFVATPPILGSVYAGLIALKPTFAPFVACHFLWSIGATALASRSARTTMRWGGGTAASALLFASPWLALHAASYRYAIEAKMNSVATLANAVVASPGTLIGDGLGSLFSNIGSFYGESPLHITILVFIVGGAAVAPLMIRKSARSEDTRGPAHFFVGAWLALASTYLAMMLVVAPRVIDQDTALRYFCPVAIGSLPPLTLLSAAYIAQIDGIWLRRIAWGTNAIALLAGLAFLAGGLFQRVEQVLSTGTILAFRATATSPHFLAYSEDVLHGSTMAKIERLQALIPEHESAMAWIGAPFYLDFRRNTIYDVELGGLVNPWAHLPPAHYVLWQFSGYGIDDDRGCSSRAHASDAHEQALGITCLQFRKLLARLGSNAEVLYDDEEFVLFRTPLTL
ncbi:MAG TPA: hypothetical protein VEJ16_10450 [Alphaproteobacteria bacterium]|nr:hypothetical protein [Alphaproteobacteria bacterium]